MMPILLGTHHYEWALKPFANLYSKYFGNEKILYIGDRVEKELPSNVIFQRVIAFPDGKWDWYSCFGEGLKSIGYFYTGEIFLLFLLDHWLNQPVDRGVIDKLVEYMTCHPNVVRANLTEDTCWHTGEVEQIEKWKDLDIVEIKPWSVHAGLHGAITFCPSLWRAELLARVVQSDWSFHDCEAKGSQYIRQVYPEVRTIGSLPTAIYRTHGLFHGQPKKASLQGLSETDKQIVIEALPDGFTYLP